MMRADAEAPASRSVGRYVLLGEIGSGGMATVHLGRMKGPAGFARTVAVKGLFPQLARDPELVAMLLDEARLAARVHHPNVVTVLDVVEAPGEIFLVMEYVEGAPLAELVVAAAEAGEAIDPRVAATILAGVLHGLHAAHEAKNERGEPMGIVHRDVSPQNILVGVDGVPRVLDFGVAKAVGRAQTTRGGNLKGKLAYMPPERLQGQVVSRQTDIYAAAVVLWEALTGARLFDGETDAEVVESVLYGKVAPPSKRAPHVPPELDAIVLRGLARAPADRYATAHEMAIDLERRAGVVSAHDIGRWVERLAGTEIAARAASIAARDADACEPTHARRKLAADVANARRRRHSRIRAVILAGAMTFAAGVALFAWHTQRAAGAPSAVQVAAPADPTANANAVDTDISAAPAGQADSPHAHPGPAWRPRRPSRPPAAAGSPATSADSCNPPYTLDSRQHRHYKAACF